MNAYVHLDVSKWTPTWWWMQLLCIMSILTTLDYTPIITQMLKPKLVLLAHFIIMHKFNVIYTFVGMSISIAEWFGILDHSNWSFQHKTLRWSNMRSLYNTKHTRMVLKIKMLTCCLSFDNTILLLTLKMKKEHDPHSNPSTTCFKMN
jgi:hypothetical protein